MTLVFDPGFVKTLEERFSRRRDEAWPIFLRVAKHPNLAQLRQQIETWFAELDPIDAPKIFQKIRNADFMATLNEIGIHHYFKSRGLSPRYEQEFATSTGILTPDWYVPPTADSPEFICDVVAVNPSNMRMKRLQAIDDLKARLSAIERSFIIVVDIDRNSVLTPNRNKQIAHEFRELLRADARVGAQLELDDVRLRVAAPTNANTLQVLGPVITFWPSTDDLKDKIYLKESKYRPIGLPLVVAVVPDFLAGYDAEEVVAALAGQPVYEYSFDDDMARQTSRTTGLFDEKPALSACLHARVFPALTVTVHLNPAAARPLPGTLLVTV